MRKHYTCVLAVGFALQTSSIAAVRAEWSGSASGETTREVSSEAKAENADIENKTASEDFQKDSSKAVATPTLNNNNIINVETGSQARSASTQAQAMDQSQQQAQAQNQNQGQFQDQHQRYQRRQEVLAYRGETEVGYVEHHHGYDTVSVTPMLGAGFWRGLWKMSVSNDYTFGVLLEFPVTSIFSIETEGAYGSYNMRYTDVVYQHHFDQWTAGLNGKLYLSRSRFRPYIGLGMDAVYYQGMNNGPLAPNGFAMRGYNQWIGAGQLLTGADVHITDSIALGARLTYSQPLVNQPSVTTIATPAGPMAAPGCEEAAAINTGYYQTLGTVKVSF